MTITMTIAATMKLVVLLLLVVSLHLGSSFFLVHPPTLRRSSTSLLKSRVHHRPRHGGERLQATLVVNEQDGTASPTTSVAKEDDPIQKDDDDTIRPFHQNWWPVFATACLDPLKPNPLQVLGKNLVAVYDASSAKWSVLEDRCSHRFAPLSEGRLVVDATTQKTCVQCSYHGWEFEAGTGTCTKLPQQPDKVDKAQPVTSYPVRNEAGMLWVWTDPKTSASLADNVPLPISPALKQHVHKVGQDACFMRDLPYGFEILGENLLDLSHLPFSHHSVGNLRRELGTKLPTRMLSEDERRNAAAWETTFKHGAVASPVLPRHQVEFVDAGNCDPILLSMKQQPGQDTSTWTSRLGFYEPSHVRYRRCLGSDDNYSHVEIFMCPTTEGRSRVFLFNIFQRPPPPPAPKQTTLQKLQRVLKPSTWKTIIMSVILKRIMQQKARLHLFTHQIFDGDGIFLHKQGNRMREAALTFRDYCTPSSADVLLNAYRRFLEVAARNTRDQGGLNAVAQAVVGEEQYRGDLPRSQMLDRYNTHTKYCKACRTALQKEREFKSKLVALQTASWGAAGASVAAFLTLAALRATAALAVAPAILGTVASAVVTTLCASIVAGKLKRKTEENINQYLFQDYVHADKV